MLNASSGRGAPRIAWPGSQTMLSASSTAPGASSGANQAVNCCLKLVSMLPYACDNRKTIAPDSAPSTCATTRVRRTPSSRTRPSVMSIDSDAASAAVPRTTG